MKRRTLIKSGILAGVALVANRTFGHTLSDEAVDADGLHTIELGDLKLRVVTDGHLLFKPVQPHFAPKISPTEVKKLLDENFLPDAADLSVNVLYVENGNKRILIDSGCGSILGDSTGLLYKNLPKAGIPHTSITDIVLSHAHPDHVGGLLDKSGGFVFPNARIHIAKPEYDFWTSPNPDLSKSILKDAQLKALIIRVAATTLAKVKSRLQLFDDGDTLLDCLRVKIAPGHTPGHTVTTVFSQGQEIVHVADLVHSPVLVFAHPEWGFEGDTDFEQAIATRKSVLAQLADSRTQVFSYHLPWPGLGHIRRKGQGFEWVQNEFALPD